MKKNRKKSKKSRFLEWFFWWILGAGAVLPLPCKNRPKLIKNERNLEKFTKITKIPQNQLKPPRTSKNHQKLMQKTFFSGSKNFAVAPRLSKSGENVSRKACWDHESKKEKTRIANKKFVRSARQKLCAFHFDDGFVSNFFAVCAANFFWRGWPIPGKQGSPPWRVRTVPSVPVKVGRFPRGLFAQKQKKIPTKS